MARVLQPRRTRVQVGQVAAGAAQDGLVAEGVQLTGGGDQVAQEDTVLIFNALAGGNDDIVALFFQLGDAGQEGFLVKGALR